MHRFLLLMACTLAAIPKVYSEIDTCKKHQCIAVIDAGSTGSRLHVYSYDIDHTHSPIHINEIWSKNTKPGFSSIEPDLNSVGAYLSLLLAGAPVQHVPMYFYATAGMRLLPNANQKIHYQALERWFLQQQDLHLEAYKTITGNEEALYDWLAVNYNLGTLQSPQKQTVGVMDMGGASVQIAFPIQKPQTLNQKSEVEVDIYGRHIYLSVHSFLGLGQTEMSHQFLNSPHCFSNQYPLPDGELGQGNAPSCEGEISSLMNAVHGVNGLIHPVLAANPVDSWYAIGGLSYLVDSKAFHFEHNHITNQNLLQQADSQLCHQEWDNLNTQFPNDNYVYGYCLVSAYYYALMVDGYGLYPNQTVNYLPSNQNIDWTMGVVLHHKMSQKKSTF